mgnify:FL=1
MVKTRNQLRKSNYKRTAKLGRDVYLPDKGGYTVIRNTPGTGNPKHPLYIIGDKKKQLKKKLSKKQKCSNYDCKRWFEVSAHVTCENDKGDYIVPLCRGCNNPKRYKPFWVSPYIEMVRIQKVYTRHPSKPISDDDILV